MTAKAQSVEESCESKSDEPANATGIQMGNQMPYAGRYVRNQIDHIVNQNVVNQNENDCFITLIQQPTYEIHSSDSGRTYNVKAITKVEKIQYLLMFANKEESGIRLTAEENDFIVKTKVNENSADLNGNYIFMANQQATTS